MSTNPPLRLLDVVRTYGSGDTAVRAIDHVTVDFAAHQLTAIVGPSGSGKSTLMQCAAGLDRVDSGQIFLGDKELTRLSDDELTRLRRDHVGFVFQSFNLMPTLNAEDNIRLPLLLAGRPVDQKWFNVVVDMLDIRARLSHRPEQLSGGQQQRVAIARALMTRPEVIFADEPTGALDQDATRAALTFMRRSIDEFGQTMIMVTHDPSVAAWADRVIGFTDGHVARDRKGA
jgi:putative ABC transport system ATP-binding protein